MLAFKTMKLEVNMIAAVAHALLEMSCIDAHFTDQGDKSPLKSIILVVALCDAVMATHDLLS